MAVPAISVRVAVDVLDPDVDVEKVVDPHPLVVGVAMLPETKMKSGSSKVKASPMVISALEVNANDIDVEVETIGAVSESLLCDSTGAAISVDVKTLVAPMFVAPVKTTAAVRSPKFAACVELDVVTPVAIVKVQNVYLVITAPMAVKATAALVVPELLSCALNVVVPQPLVLGTARLPSTKLGNTRVMTSLMDKSALHANENDTEVGAEVTGLSMTNKLCVSTGFAVAVDVTIAVLEMSTLEPARVTATVRVLRFAACTAAAVVTPAPSVSVHFVKAARICPTDTRAIDAVAVPEPDGVAVKVVVLHPLALGDRELANVNPGRTTVSVSPTLSATLSANEKDIDELALVMSVARDSSV